jgi:hypothetical protein
MSALALAALIATLLSTGAAAKTVDGVDFPDTATVGGATLVRNGIGARTAMFMRFYLAALYVEKASHEAAGLLGPDRPREARLAILKDVSRERFLDAAKAGFEKNTPSPSPDLQARMDTFLALIPPLKPGDTLNFTYVPGTGTRIHGSAVKATTIPGKDFADALFKIWLGGHPADGDLKSGLLGNASL